MKNNIWLITGSRADYGCTKYIIEKSEFMHVEIKIGVESLDRFINFKKGKIDIPIARKKDISKMFAEIMKEFNELFTMFAPEKIVVLGDRWEILSVCLTAAFHNIDIAHIGGGEISLGVYDNVFRYTISDLAKYHFVVSEDCVKRLYQREITGKCYVVGSPRLDYDIKKLPNKEYKRRTALVIIHPETLGKDIDYSVLYETLKECDLDYIVIESNIDIGHEKISELNLDFFRHGNVKLCYNLPLDNYLEILNSVDIMIGNSSAGIMEAASFELPVINVGDRQKGRDRQKNIIDVGWDKEEIKNGIIKALSLKFKKSLDGMKNIYYNNASQKIVDILEKL